MLLFAHKDRRHSIAEFEDALLKAELAHKLDAFNAIPIGAMNRVDRRPHIIQAFEEIFNADEAKKLEEFFPYATKRKNQLDSISDYLDSRSREELENSFALIPPFVPGNGTFQAKEPVHLEDGTPIHIDYFRLLAGLKAAWLQRNLPEEELVELICSKWQDVDPGWVDSTIGGANGSVGPGSYWHFTRLCGYQLSKRSGTAYDNAPDADEIKAISVQLTTEERTKEIEAKFQQLYEVKGAYEDTFAQQEALTKELYDLGVGRETISRRLLVMLGKEFGFDNNADTTARKALPATTITAPVEDLIPGLVMRGRVAVVAGTYGSWKTTAAALIGDKVGTGGELPLMAGPVKEKGRVLFIASDGGEGAISTVKKYAARCGSPLERHGDKFQFFGANRDLNQVSWSFCFRDLRRLVEHLQEYADDPMPVRLVIIDSFHAVMDLAGLDSGIGPMNEAMRLLGDIAAKNDVSILLLHHTLKSNAGVIAGHATIPQIADSVHFLTKEDRLWQDQRVREWKVDKHRGGEERTVEFIIENDEGIKVAPKDTSDAVQELILAEMYFERFDGSSPRNLTNYLTEHNLKETRVKKELAAMRRAGLLRTANNRWFLQDEGLERAIKMNKQAIAAHKSLGEETKSTAEDVTSHKPTRRQEAVAKETQKTVRAKEEAIAAEEEANRPSAEEVNAQLAKDAEEWNEVKHATDTELELIPADESSEACLRALGLDGAADEIRRTVA